MENNEKESLKGSEETNQRIIIYHGIIFKLTFLEKVWLEGVTKWWYVINLRFVE